MKKKIDFSEWTPDYESCFFKPSEFFASEIAKDYKINNTPHAWVVIQNLSRIAYFLDEVRREFGEDICVSSGYRCDLLNKLVGGANKSYHKCGLAADIYPRLNSPKKLLKLFSILEQYDLKECILYNETKHVIHIALPYPYEM